MTGSRIFWWGTLGGLLAVTLLLRGPLSGVVAGQEAAPGAQAPTAAPAEKSPAKSAALSTEPSESASPSEADSPSDADVGKTVDDELQDTGAEVVESGKENDKESIPRAAYKRQMLLASLTIFALAMFVGFEVITKVPPTLHTPLMSGSNAISGITIVGALIVAGHGSGWFTPLLGLVAVALAAINVVGGFLVTHRMLAMFKKR